MNKLKNQKLYRAGKIAGYMQGRKETINEIIHIIDCQIDAIASGNVLTPPHQETAIKALKIIKQLCT